MDKLEMPASFRIGHDEIDDDHEKIIDIINEIKETITDEEVEACRRLFDSFIRMAKDHFDREEGILREAGFPRLDEHAVFHDELLKKAHRVKKLCIDMSDRELLRECFDEMAAFMIEDVVRGDLDFKSFLEEKGLAKLD